MASVKIINPIIPGFHPDPSVCRVGRDYYLVNSTFEYFPGVPVHHSRDLVHWRLIGHCLTRESQLPLRGVPPSDGIYAPTIRHHAGRFYMVTTNIRGGGNFIVHAEDPAGPWSEPVWLAQRGIDPSLCFAADGRVFLTSNGTNWAPVRGLYQCEIDPLTGEQLTETRFLWPGTGGAYPEAPHLFEHAGFHYLVAAEGGTAEGHMVTIARSRDPYGPFESCPRNPVLSHRSLMGDIHATGHADFFEDHRGDWWVVFLGIRYGEHGWHHLGRETFLAPVEWDADGWPVVNGGRPVMLEMETDRAIEPHPWPAAEIRDDFDTSALSPVWVHLRNPQPGSFSLAARPGFLRLHGTSVSLDEAADPSCLLRRVQHMEFTARALLDAGAEAPDEAGLTVLIDHRHRADLIVRRRDGRRETVLRRRIGPATCEGDAVPVPDGPLILEVTGSSRVCRFAVVGGDFRADLGEHETRYLSTEVSGGYTGAMIGLFAFSSGGGGHADFDWFEYQPGLTGEALRL